MVDLSAVGFRVVLQLNQVNRNKPVCDEVAENRHFATFCVDLENGDASHIGASERLRRAAHLYIFKILSCQATRPD